MATFAQSSIEGFILDEATKEALPYATIKIISDTSYYTISNEDGKFEINPKFVKDSIEVTYIGFKATKVPLSYFKENNKLYLTPNAFDLNEVVVMADDDYAYNLLENLIKKYRKNHLVSQSKAFLTLTSSARNIPIEQVEGFYNSSQSLSDGLLNLKIKSGRFGQNKSFAFYSLDNTKILSDFQFFESSDQILPEYPGNLSGSAIKRKYDVRVDECSTCRSEDIQLSFFPKKANGRLFSGTILFNNDLQIIKRIELSIKDPVTKDLTSISDNVTISPNEIVLNITFNPSDYTKIQYLDFTFILNYDSTTSKEIIKSHTFLYFYDYNTIFKEPYFTHPTHFNNDYDEMIALQATPAFWDANYQFPKSYNEKRSLDFMKKYGYLINYDNAISSHDLKYTKPSVVAWSNEKRLEWESIQQSLVVSKKIKRSPNAAIAGTVNADEVFHSTIDANKGTPYSDSNGKYIFTYIADQYKNAKGQNQYSIRTLFDRNASFYKYNRTKNKLVYINLMFDIYEYHRQTLEEKISPEMTFETVKAFCKEQFDTATTVVNKLNKETNFGDNYQSLIQWNNNIKSKMDIDNFSLIK
tara:strand:+ start:196038 stop:197786 length:1749 start_codon:yes stop_codon:yes gene_type:complete